MGGWWFILTCLLFSVVTGCIEPTYVAPTETVNKSRIQPVELLTNKVDILLVVDNSASMCEEQNQLGQALTALDARLSAQGIDWRIAVTTTDANAGGGQFVEKPVPSELSLNCLESGIAPNTDDCHDLPAGVSFTSVLRHDVSPDPQVRAKLIRCMALRGTDGSSFEQGLAATQLALSCGGPNAQSFGECCVDGIYNPTCSPKASPAFLRPDAVLAVVIISDEDDCSDPITDTVDDLGLTCIDPLDPDCQIQKDAAANCAWDSKKLVPVDAYEAFLRSLKMDPDRQIIFASLSGKPATTETGHVIHYQRGIVSADCRPSLGVSQSQSDTCCPNGRCTGQPQPVCSSSMGEAYAGARYARLAEKFGEQGLGCSDSTDPECVSLCEANGVSRMIQKLAVRLDKIMPTTSPDGLK